MYNNNIIDHYSLNDRNESIKFLSMKRDLNYIDI